jgi:predicted TIM-barrel fold metal-dependent hydrolase
LQGIGAAALAGMTAEQANAQQVLWSSGTEPAKIKMPADACDCHHHIYDGRFPIAPSATLKPGDAKPADYRALQKRIGTTRSVVVQPSTYGTDNSCTLDGMAQLGSALTRGVAVVDTSVTDAELKRLHGLGIRGIRFNLVQAGATTVEMLEPLSRRVNDLGWHVQIHQTGDGIVKMEDVLAKVASPIVFDHMGRIPKDVGVNHPAYAVISKLIDKGRTWVKISGAYMDTKVGPPTYADSTRLAQAYVKAAPQRMVWGSDWPHPTQKDDEKANDAILADLLLEWAPDEATRNRILVDNPATIYGFGKAS